MSDDWDHDPRDYHLDPGTPAYVAQVAAASMATGVLAGGLAYSLTGFDKTSAVVVLVTAALACLAGWLVDYLPHCNCPEDDDHA